MSQKDEPPGRIVSIKVARADGQTMSFAGEEALWQWLGSIEPGDGDRIAFDDSDWLSLMDYAATLLRGKPFVDGVNDSLDGSSIDALSVEPGQVEATLPRTPAMPGLGKKIPPPLPDHADSAAEGAPVPVVRTQQYGEAADFGQRPTDHAGPPPIPDTEEHDFPHLEVQGQNTQTDSPPLIETNTMAERPLLSETIPDTPSGIGEERVSSESAPTPRESRPAAVSLDHSGGRRPTTDRPTRPMSQPTGPAFPSDAQTLSFEGEEPPPAPVKPPSSGAFRGFVLGVACTLAVLSVLYLLSVGPLAERGQDGKSLGGTVTRTNTTVRQVVKTIAASPEAKAATAGPEAEAAAKAAEAIPKTGSSAAQPKLEPSKAPAEVPATDKAESTKNDGPGGQKGIPAGEKTPGGAGGDATPSRKPVSAKETKTENAPEKVPAKDLNSVAANGAEVGPGKGMSPRDEDAPKEALGSSVDPAKKPKSDKADGPKASGTGPSEGSSGTTPRAASTRKGTSKVSARDFSKLMKTGLDHLEGGRPRQAQTVFEQAVRANPSSPRPVANLGWCALDLGQARQAVGLFKRALKLDASHRDAFFGLGKAQEKAGMKVEAAQTYREYLEKYPEDRRARMVRFRLETLSGK